VEDIKNRIRIEELLDRVVSAEEAASWIEDGMSLGLSGFTRAGDVKVVPRALVKRAEKEPLKVSVYTGASLGADTDKLLAESGILHKRSPFQADPAMRKKINEGDFYFVDIIPTTQVGNSAIFAEHAKNIIVEINLAHPLSFEGVHDIYDPGKQGERMPIPLIKASDRIGTIGIPVDINKIKGIVINNEMDSPSTIVPPDEETQIMANHLIEFLRKEIAEGRLTNSLAPLQSGIGSVANAVLHGLLVSEFEDLEVYSEVLQDAVFDLLDAGKVKFASCCSITISEEKMKKVFGNFEKYKDRLMLRPQEISNHPELIRRLGLISINTALEVDIYGNVNSTHVRGTHMMNGIGGSGDFARNARLAIFVTKSVAKGGTISSIVPFVSHVDHTEHDVDVIVTEQGYADLRGLAPRERVELIIEKCAHPSYRAQLRDYYYEALAKGGQTPHNLEKAFSWHTNFEKTGTMLETEKELEPTKN